MQCDECEQSFVSKYYLGRHHTSMHAKDDKSCENCGLIVRSEKELRIHDEEYHGQKGFQEVKKRACYFFQKGKCYKGEQCRFSHDEKRKSTRENIPECRNGDRCSYRVRGVCRYLHRNVKYQASQVQSSYQNNIPETTRWCKFLEDCNRVPNCTYKHYDEVFPRLPNVNNPPWGGY